jgi:transcription initiation factor TFIIIB Brf1 subunit/transcription initiation factor TFIIB|tara:strand:- start:395 stop:577 length:183 start_codon:yes stop_codon:yes gene_type:complete
MKKTKKKATIIKKNECPECGSSNVKYNKSKDEIICRDCGAIFSQLTPKEEKRFEEAHEQK